MFFDAISVVEAEAEDLRGSRDPDRQREHSKVQLKVNFRTVVRRKVIPEAIWPFRDMKTAS